MKDLEKFIKENRDRFDLLEPKNTTWDNLESNILIKKGKKANKIIPLRLFFMKIAASILILIGASFMWNQYSYRDVSVFENIALSSPDGETILLDPSQNKLTLVQFWKSGNVVCTDDNCYYYKPAYEKYKDKGFEIYSISLDMDKEAWLSNIEEQELPWTQVSDLLGWESPVCIACEVTEVPTSFLLNQRGDIIAKNLVAADLEETLKRYL